LVTAEPRALVISAKGGGHGPVSSGAKSTRGRFADITVPERIGATLLISITLLIGLYPRLLLDLIEPALHSPLLENVMKAGDR
jgi:NADH-quinone oxidoreductase subunit M